MASGREHCSLGRPLPVGETYRAFSGFMPVPHGHQDAMLAAIDSGDSEEIADALAAMLAPPRLANTDGQDLIAHTITWRVPQPDAVGTALVGAGLQAEGDDHWTLVRDSKNQDNTVIASLRLDGDELTVEVNSAERAAELQLLVADALPDAEVIDVDAHPFEMPDEPVRTSGMRSPTWTTRRSGPRSPSTSPATSGGGSTSRSRPSAGARHVRRPATRSGARS